MSECREKKDHNGDGSVISGGMVTLYVEDFSSDDDEVVDTTWILSKRINLGESSSEGEEEEENYEENHLLARELSPTPRPSNIHVPNQQNNAMKQSNPHG